MAKLTKTTEIMKSESSQEQINRKKIDVELWIGLASKKRLANFSLAKLNLSGNWQANWMKW